METRQRKLTGIVVEIPKIVVSLDVAGIAFEREREVVERLRYVALFQVDDRQVAVSFSHIVAFADCLHITFGRFRIALLVQQQRLFERRQQTCQPGDVRRGTDSVVPEAQPQSGECSGPVTSTRAHG